MSDVMALITIGIGLAVVAIFYPLVKDLATSAHATRVILAEIRDALKDRPSR
jgi:hypothetical protein